MLNKIPALKKSIVGAPLILLGTALFLASCSDSHVPVTASGEALAKQYCSTCHAMADPALLDRETWKTSVLPNMATRLGINASKTPTHATERAALTPTEWDSLQAFYLRSAPDRLTPAQQPPATPDWGGFRLKKPLLEDRRSVMTTLVAFDSANHSIISGDGGSYRLVRWSKNLVPIDTLAAGSPPSSLSFSPGQTALTTLGTMQASNVAEGKLLLTGAGDHITDTIALKLPRPVQSIAADINHDGLTDWVVCAFGHDRGGLYWYAAGKDKKYTQHLIFDMPGALQAIAGDYNNDGWTDLIVLFGEADECIRLFTNDRHGGFLQQKLLSFPAVYGSSSVQLADFNGDGRPDILYTCGDNNDFSPIAKPYHGIYIYLNQGNNQFKQAWFFPMNGCTKAIAADFDLDGDLDIATIAFYANFTQHSPRKFLYLQQDSLLHFQAHQLPLNDYGRWMCMDVSDYDGDGDADIVLGNFSVIFKTDVTNVTGWNEHLPFIILENTKHN